MPETPKKALPSTKKVFLIDDDDTIIQLFRTSLELEGFQVRTFKDGRNILKKAKDFKPDLIIMDLMMPGGGGYEAIRELQSDDDFRRVPVIIMTGSNMDYSTKSMIQTENNVVSYFEKPFRYERLAKEIHARLNTMSFQEQQAQEKKTMPTGFDELY